MSEPIGLPEAEDLKSLLQWNVDLKIYEYADAAECPYQLPKELYSRQGERFEPGVYSVTVSMKQEDFDKFYTWARNRGWIKIIGSEQITF